MDPAEQEKLIQISKAILRVLERSREGKILRKEFHDSVNRFKLELEEILPADPLK